MVKATTKTVTVEAAALMERAIPVVLPVVPASTMVLIPWMTMADGASGATDNIARASEDMVRKAADEAGKKG